MSAASKPPALPLAPFFVGKSICVHAPIKGLRGGWVCQKCNEKIEIAEAQQPDHFPELAALTDRVTVARAAAIIERKTKVPLEAKGLKAAMMQVQVRMASVTAKARKLEEVGAGLEYGLDDVLKQVQGHSDDFEFGANTLANFTEQSGK